MEQANHLRRAHCGRLLFFSTARLVGICHAGLWELEGWTDVRGEQMLGNAMERGALRGECNLEPR